MMELWLTPSLPPCFTVSPEEGLSPQSATLPHRVSRERIQSPAWGETGTQTGKSKVEMEGSLGWESLTTGLKRVSSSM